MQALDAARVRIDELRAVQVELRREVGPSGDVSHLRIGDDTTPLTAIVERAAALGGIGAAEHTEARSWLDAVADGSATVHPTARELLRASAEIEEAWERAAAAGVEGEPEVIEATRRRDELERQRELLAGLARSGVLGDTAKSEIESAHAAVVASGGRGDDKAARLDAEDAALSRYGFDSLPGLHDRHLDAERRPEGRGQARRGDRRAPAFGAHAGGRPPGCGRATRPPRRSARAHAGGRDGVPGVPPRGSGGTGTGRPCRPCPTS